MKENDRTQGELEVEEVNLFASDCGKIKLECETDCPFNTPFLSPNN